MKDGKNKKVSEEHNDDHHINTQYVLDSHNIRYFVKRGASFLSFFFIF